MSDGRNLRAPPAASLVDGGAGGTLAEGQRGAAAAAVVETKFRDAPQRIRPDPLASGSFDSAAQSAQRAFLRHRAEPSPRRRKAIADGAAAPPVVRAGVGPLRQLPFPSSLDLSHAVGRPLAQPIPSPFTLNACCSSMSPSITHRRYHRRLLPSRHGRCGAPDRSTPELHRCAGPTFGCTRRHSAAQRFLSTPRLLRRRRAGCASLKPRPEAGASRLFGRDASTATGASTIFSDRSSGTGTRRRRSGRLCRLGPINHHAHRPVRLSGERKGRRGIRGCRRDCDIDLCILASGRASDFGSLSCLSFYLHGGRASQLRLAGCGKRSSLHPGVAISAIGALSFPPIISAPFQLGVVPAASVLSPRRAGATPTHSRGRVSTCCRRWLLPAAVLAMPLTLALPSPHHSASPIYPAGCCCTALLSTVGKLRCVSSLNALRTLLLSPLRRLLALAPRELHVVQCCASPCRQPTLLPAKEPHPIQLCPASSARTPPPSSLSSLNMAAATQAQPALTAADDNATHSPGAADDQPAIPGTVHLVDLEGTMRAKHAAGAAAHDIVLVPAPSDE